MGGKIFIDWVTELLFHNSMELFSGLFLTFSRIGDITKNVF